MSATLESSVWYRVADLRPKLRSHARLHRHRYRNQVWYLLEDPASGRVNRFTASARLLVMLMDGTRRVSEIWDIAHQRQGEAAPTQDEVIQLLGQLHAADLLQTDVTPDVAELFARTEREERGRGRRAFGNPMAIRLPLWDPDAFLDRVRPVFDRVWSRAGLLLWLLVVLPAAFLIPPHWPELSNNFSDRVLAVDNLFILYLVFPILKALHEMGHATAVKARGGEVHDLGLIFLVMLPVPYVEASAAIAFKSKYQRALVGAAGVAVELFVAALAFYLWLLVEPGPVRAALFNTMLIAGVSTLVFNGNPLLRYDAYFVLADLIEIPNLAARAQRHWRSTLERLLFGVRDAPPDASRREVAWLLAYGAASAVYRVIVSVFIALFIAGRFFFIGILLAIWAVTMMAVMPALRFLGYLTHGPQLHGRRKRAVTVGAGGLAVLACAALLVPLPDYTYAQGVVWLSDQALVRATSSGFLTAFATQPGAQAVTDDRLVVLQEPSLRTQIAVSEAKVVELDAAYTVETNADRVRADIARKQLASEQANLAALRQRAADLTVRARTGGTFVVSEQADMMGRYYRKGDLLGWMIGPAPPVVRVVVPQDAVDRVRLDADRVRVRLLDTTNRVLDAKIVRTVPGGDEYLPSRAFAAENGGDIATDPRDTKGPKTLQRTFQFDVELQDSPGFDQFGQRVMVRFEHPGAPLVEQAFRGLRLLFLSRFSV